MNIPFLISAVLIIGTAFVHSILGERLVLMPLFKLELPPLVGSIPFMRRVLRFAWHLTTVAWLGTAFLLAKISSTPLDTTGLLFVKMTILVALLSGIISLMIARGRHFSWIVFLLVSWLLWRGSTP